MLTTLRITPMLQTQIDRVRRAAALYPNADDGYLPLEQEQVALAEVLLREVERQAAGAPRLPVRARAMAPVLQTRRRSRRRA